MNIVGRVREMAHFSALSELGGRAHGDDITIIEVRGNRTLPL